MNFANAFEKIAGIAGGLRAAGQQTVKDVVTLKGAREAVSGLRGKYKGKMADLVKTKAGRSDLGNAAAKSLPSAVMGGLYLKGAGKAYDSMKRDSQNQYDQQYYS